MVSRIKNTNHARAIRRGIEYGKRENAAFHNNDFEGYGLAITQTERYIRYLGPVESRLFRDAWLRTKYGVTFNLSGRGN